MNIYNERKSKYRYTYTYYSSSFLNLLIIDAFLPSTETPFQDLTPLKKGNISVWLYSYFATQMGKEFRARHSVTGIKMVTRYVRKESRAKKS